MILAAMLGISIGMVFARSAADYSERVFTLMANPVATVAVVCWLWAGAFSGILAKSKLVEAIVWLGWQSGVSGAVFTVLVFVLASLFAVSVGTGLGTVLGFTPVMYPAGVVLGGRPGRADGGDFQRGRVRRQPGPDFGYHDRLGDDARSRCCGRGAFAAEVCAARGGDLLRAVLRVRRSGFATRIPPTRRRR